jgi:hypothetical protein
VKPLICLNSNGENGPARIPISYIGHQLPTRITVSLNDGYDGVVPTQRLIENSEYFFRCFNGDWREVKRGKVALDFDVASWCIFREWLESGIANSQPLVPPGVIIYGLHNSMSDWKRKTNSSLDLNDNIKSIARLIRAWLLADYLVAPHFQNDVIEELTCAYENCWQRTKAIPWSHMRLICENTTPISQLRQIVLDLIQFGISKRLIDLSGEVSKFVQEFGFTISPELAEGLDRGHGVIRPAPWNRCRTFYHVFPKVSRCACSDCELAFVKHFPPQRYLNR